MSLEKGCTPFFNCKNCNCKIFRTWLTYSFSKRLTTRRSSSAASRQKSRNV